MIDQVPSSPTVAKPISSCDGPPRNRTVASGSPVPETVGVILLVGGRNPVFASNPSNAGLSGVKTSTRIDSMCGRLSFPNGSVWVADIVMFAPLGKLPVGKVKELEAKSMDQFPSTSTSAQPAVVSVVVPPIRSLKSKRN